MSRGHRRLLLRFPLGPVENHTDGARSLVPNAVSFRSEAPEVGFVPWKRPSPAFRCPGRLLVGSNPASPRRRPTVIKSAPLVIRRTRQAQLRRPCLVYLGVQGKRLGARILGQWPRYSFSTLTREELLWRCSQQRVLKVATPCGHIGYARVASFGDQDRDIWERRGRGSGGCLIGLGDKHSTPRRGLGLGQDRRAVLGWGDRLVDTFAYMAVAFHGLLITGKLYNKYHGHIYTVIELV